jgi:tripartite-type tricarboxylate transporter receptor subunit TctC
LIGGAVAALAVIAVPALAETLEQFYKGKTITILVGVAPGGSYDIYGRLAAWHLGKHVPGQPTVVVRNQSGAGGLTALNSFYQVLPKDGTALNVVPTSLALVQLLGQTGLAATQPP